MPYILGVLAAAAGVYFRMMRARNAACVASDLAVMGQDGIAGELKP